MKRAAGKSIKSKLNYRLRCCPAVAVPRQDYIDGPADKNFERERDIAFLSPFLPEEKVYELMLRAETEGREEELAFFPFVSEERSAESLDQNKRLPYAVKTRTR